jgi:hypothetical protein
MSWDNKNLSSNYKSWWPTPEGAGAQPSRERSILGQCRRHAPPTMVFDLPDHGKRYPGWSTTKRDDWCGDHEPGKCELRRAS